MIEVVLERCAGIDIGKRFVVVCLLTGAAGQSPRMEKRQYDATVGELERLRE
jgi:transposase